ncbi:unnamed protein product [Phaeothamnion confervicola]
MEERRRSLGGNIALPKPLVLEEYVEKERQNGATPSNQAKSPTSRTGSPASVANAPKTPKSTRSARTPRVENYDKLPRSMFSVEPLKPLRPGSPRPPSPRPLSPPSQVLVGCFPMTGLEVLERSRRSSDPVVIQVRPVDGQPHQEQEAAGATAEREGFHDVEEGGQVLHIVAHSQSPQPSPAHSPSAWSPLTGARRLGGIHGLVCCYRESKAELATMLTSFSKGARLPVPLRLSLIMDGHPRREDLDASPTFQALVELLGIAAPYDGNGAAEFGCRVFTGKVGAVGTPFDLYIKGPTLERGKRVSMVHFLTQILPERIERGDVDEPEALYLTDADSGHPANGMADVFKIYSILMSQENIAGCTSQVRPVNWATNVLTAAQRLEYLLWEHVGSSRYGAVWTCVGMSSMLKYRCLNERRYGLPSFIEAFSAEATNLNEMILLDNSEDAAVAVFLRQRGYDCKSCGVTDTVTYVPSALPDFYGQRRRWTAGALVCFPSHLLGINSYFRWRKARWIFASYASMVYLTYHLALAIVPPLLASGTALIISTAAELRYSSEGVSPLEVRLLGESLPIKWFIYGGIWAFFCTHAYYTMDRPHREVETWLRVTAYIWGIYTAVVFTAVSICYQPLIAVVGLGLPLALGCLHSHPRHWPGLLVAVVCFYPVMSVYAVLVFVYALANIDSRQWGTRGVQEFHSSAQVAGGVVRKTMHHQKVAVLVIFFLISFGTGVVALYLPPQTLLTYLGAVLPFATFSLKMVVVTLPGLVERFNQMRIVWAWQKAVRSSRRPRRNSKMPSGEKQVVPTEKTGASLDSAAPGTPTVTPPPPLNCLGPDGARVGRRGSRGGDGGGGAGSGGSGSRCTKTTDIELTEDPSPRRRRRSAVDRLYALLGSNVFRPSFDFGREETKR